MSHHQRRYEDMPTLTMARIVEAGYEALSTTRNACMLVMLVSQQFNRPKDSFRFPRAIGRLTIVGPNHVLLVGF